MNLNYINPRKLKYDSCINGNKLCVLCPDDDFDNITVNNYSIRIMKKYNIEVEIKKNINITEAAKINNTIILIGNLSNNLCIKDLYFRYLCVTDCWYPGQSGYEIRTLINPFGNGYNAILIGYSDNDGLKNAIRVFADEFNNPIPYINKVHATRLPIPENEVKIVRNSLMPEKDWQVINSNYNYRQGYLAYLLDDKKLLKQYIDAWNIILNCDCNDIRYYGLHLYMLGHIITWRILDLYGYIPEETNKSIINYLLYWAGSEEGIKCIDIDFYKAEGVPRQNHGLIPALTLLYLYDYLSTYYEVRDEWRKWRDVALKVFEPYNNGSWKPMCDGLCHGWWLSQPMLLEYGLLDPEHKYFKNNGARKAAECAVAVVNNSGWMPSAGDSDLLRGFPGYVLRAAAAYYGDPRYRFVNDLAPEYRRNKIHIMPGRMFDTGLKGEFKDLNKITVIPMDELIYKSYETNYEISKNYLNSAPNTSIEKCFDKIAIRTGWEKTDQYLLVDGLGTKSSAHSYSDAMCIQDYQCFGYSFIVQEDLLLWPEPESHSGITIVKDGETGLIPSFAEIINQHENDDGSLCITIRLSNISGCDWIRKICLNLNHTVVFYDQVIIKEDGNYAVEDHFRIPGIINKSNNKIYAMRNSSEYGEIEFSLEGECNKDVSYSAYEVPVNLFYRVQPGEKVMSEEDDASAAWKRRYGIDEILLSSFNSRCTGSFVKGDSIEFVHTARVDIKKTGRDNEKDTVLICDNGKANDYTEGGMLKHIIRFDQSIKDFEILDDEKKLIALNNGDISFLCSSNVLWTKKLSDPIYSMSFIKKEKGYLFFIAHGDSEIAAVNENGTVIWNNKIKREPSPYPWWELNKPGAVEIKAISNKNEEGIIAGCGDMEIRMFDIEGKISWMKRFEDGIPARILPDDINNDGKAEIIIGGDIMSDTANCRIYDFNGNLKADLPVEGWTSRLTAAATAMYNGKSLIACGANHGSNLLIYNIDSTDPMNYKFKCMMEKRLGGTVTGIVIYPENNIVCAATSQGFIIAYDYITGKKIWNTLLSDSINWIVQINFFMYVFEKNGEIYRITKDGQINCLSDIHINWTACRTFKNRIYLASDEGLYYFDSEKI